MRVRVLQSRPGFSAKAREWVRLRTQCFGIIGLPASSYSREVPNVMADPNSPMGRLSEFFQRQLALFFDATSDGIIFLDRSHKITFMNRRAREMLSVSGEILGKKASESFPAAEYEGSPYAENYLRTLELGEIRQFEAYYPEPLNVWLRIQTYPTEDGVMLFLRDFTQEKQANDELLQKTEQAERQLAEIEAVYRTAPIGLALFDAKEFRYLRLNDTQAGFFGLKPEQVLGRGLTEMAPMEGLRELFEGVRDTGKPVVNYPLEGHVITRPDEHRYWTVNYFPVWGTDGSVVGITAASLEVTAQRKAEKALIQSEKLAVVGRLISSIAHEINNPLEAVTNLLYLAIHSSDVEEIHKRLALADVELRRVSAITSQTLRFHKQSTKPQDVTTESLIRSVLLIFQGRIVNSGVQILERMRASRAVCCFEGEIRQVISNLIANAFDAIGGGSGQMFLRTRLGTNWKNGEEGVVITVADNGAGMSRATVAKLFSPFFTTKGIMGTGLGLWVAKEIVARHRGVLRVRSSQSSRHHGTVFTVFLPLRAEERG